MKDASPANDLLWEERQRAHGVQTDLERRQWLMSFAVTLALIVLTLAVAAGLASLVSQGPIRL